MKLKVKETRKKTLASSGIALSRVVFFVLVLGLFILLSIYLYINKGGNSEPILINSFQSCADAGYPVMESYPEKCTTPDGKTFIKTIETGEITVTGTIECLPHKDTSGPVTLECAYGIKDDKDKHYVLKDIDMKFMGSLITGKEFTVTGKFTSEASNIYDTVGVIEITSANETGSTNGLQKTYKNNAFHFSFKYPNSWRLVENPGANNRGLIQLFSYPADRYIGGEALQPGDVKFEMVVQENTNSVNLTDYVKEATKDGLNASKEHEYKAGSVGSIKAVTDEVKGDTSYKSYYMELASGNILVLTVTPNSQSQEVLSILSSFTL